MNISPGVPISRQELNKFKEKFPIVVVHSDFDIFYNILKWQLCHNSRRNKRMIERMELTEVDDGVYCILLSYATTVRSGGGKI